MASNYPPDPRNAASVGNPVTPQSGSGPSGTVPDYPFPPVTPQGLPMPYSSQEPQQPSPVFLSSDDSSPRRLPQGTLLSGGRYKIEKPLAAGGMGAVYRAIDTRFDRPCAVKEMLDEFRDDAERTQAVEWF